MNNKDLHILYICDLSDPAMRIWIDYMMNQNIKIDVATGIPERMEGVKTIYVPSLNQKFGSITGFFLIANDLWQLLDARIGKKYDLIHIHQFPRYKYVSSALISSQKTLISLWNLSEFKIEKGRISKKSNWKIGTLERASFVTFANSGIQTLVKGATNRIKNSELIPHALSLSQQKLTGKTRSEMRGVRLCINQKLAPNTGLKKIISIFKKCIKKCPELTLNLIGRGTDAYESELKRLVRDSGLYNYIHFSGNVTKAEYIAILRKSDIYLHISDLPGYRFDLVEAMFAGLPVIATEVEGISDIIIDKINGFIISSDDQVSMHDAICALYHSEKHRVRMGQNAQEMVEKVFDIQIHGEPMLSIYHDIAGN